MSENMSKECLHSRTDRQKRRQTDILANTPQCKHTDRQTYENADKQRCRQADKWTDRQTDGWMDRQTDRRTDQLTDRQCLTYNVGVEGAAQEDQHAKSNATRCTTTGWEQQYSAAAVKVLSRLLSVEPSHTCCSWSNPEICLPLTQLTKNSSKARGWE